MTPERIKHGPTDFSDVAVNEEGDVLPTDTVFTDQDEAIADEEADVDSPQIEPDAMAAIHGLAMDVAKKMSLENPPNRRRLNQYIGRQVATLMVARRARGLSNQGILPRPGIDRAPGALGFTIRVPDAQPPELSPEDAIAAATVAKLDARTEEILKGRDDINSYIARQQAAAELGIKL